MVNFYFTAKRYKKHLSVKPQDAEVTALRKVVCPDISRVARVPASPFPSGTYIQPQQRIREKQTSKGDVGKPISQGASGRPRKPRCNSKRSSASLPRYLTAKGDHGARQHQGDNTHSNSTARMGYTEGQSITEHCRTEINLQGLTHSSHEGLAGKAPPEEEQALKQLT